MIAILDFVSFSTKKREKQIEINTGESGAYTKIIRFGVRYSLSNQDYQIKYASHQNE